MAKVPDNPRPTPPGIDTVPGKPDFLLRDEQHGVASAVGLSDRYAGKIGPGFRTERWGRVLSVQAANCMPNPGKSAQVKQQPRLKDRDCIEIEALRSVRGRQRAEVHRISHGSVQWDITWDTLADFVDDRDAEGRLYYDLLLDSPADLTWHKQEALTQAESDDGCVRPENVVNSYAVYAPVHGRWLAADGTERINYATGKFCHVYRPKLIDANGSEIWCDQTAPLTNRLRIYLPEDWCNDAMFPLTLDPTFGYTSAGASYTTSFALYTLASDASLGEAGTLTKITQHLYHSAGATRAVDMALYSDSSGAPNNRLAFADDVSVPLTSPAGGYWVDSPAMSVALSAGTYWLAWSSAWAYPYYDTATSRTKRNGTAGCPDPYGSVGNTYNYLLSSYGTYTASGGGATARNYILGGGLI